MSDVTVLDLLTEKTIVVQVLKGEKGDRGDAGSGGGSGDYQPLDADLTAIAALTPASGKVIQGNGSTWQAASLSYQQTFTQSSLSIANILPVTHALGKYPSAVVVTDNTGSVIHPDNWTNSSLNAISVDLSSFVPLTGTWTISIGV